MEAESRLRVRVGYDVSSAPVRRMRKLNPGGKGILYRGRANGHRRHRSIRSQLYGGAGYRVDVIVADHIIGGGVVVGIGGGAVVGIGGNAVVGERLGRTGGSGVLVAMGGLF